MVWSCLVSILPGMAQTEKLTDYVNPFVGTDGYGNVYPGAQIPFGGIQISPDTDSRFYDAASGYKYNHLTLMGFSLTHLSGTGIPDLGDFLFIPGTGEMKLEPGTHEDPDQGYRSRYSHDKEWASPNYYAVELADYGVKAEMTSGVRSGMFRFTYPESDNAFIMIDMNHTLWQSCEWSNLRMINDSTIFYSTRHIEKSFAENDTAKLFFETRGVLLHELTHAYQLEPQGIGSYGTNRVFWAFIEGMADAVRVANGGFDGPNARPKGGNYMDGYRTAGYFFVWLRDNKDPEFLRKFNRSTLEVIPWSFDGAIKHILGTEYSIDELWHEYQVAVGDIQV